MACGVQFDKEKSKPNLMTETKVDMTTPQVVTTEKAAFPLVCTVISRNMSAKAHLTRPQVVMSDFVTALPNSALAHPYRK